VEKNISPLSTVTKLVPGVSQGSAVTCSRCGGIFNDVSVNLCGAPLVLTNLYIILGLSHWPRGVADVNRRRSGGRHARAASSERGQTTCADWLRALAKGGGGTVRGLRGARV